VKPLFTDAVFLLTTGSSERIKNFAVDPIVVEKFKASMTHDIGKITFIKWFQSSINQLILESTVSK